MAKIFIGSSGRMIPLVNKTAECLRSDGHEPRPWTKIFEHGDITINRLLDLAGEVHGAIFVFSGDDKVEYQGSSVPQTRGNVLIEFGLFLGHLGRKRAIILNHGENRKPTDLAGLTYLDAGSQAEDLSQEAREKLRTWAAGLTPEDRITQVFPAFRWPNFGKHCGKRSACIFSRPSSLTCSICITSRQT